MGKMSLAILVSCLLTQVLTNGSEFRNSNSLKEEIASEKEIYIPYEKLENVFEGKGRRILLPYDEYLSLKAKAGAEFKGESKKKFEFDYIIGSSEHDATIKENVVWVRSEIGIDVFKPGWNEIPLNLQDSAVSGATLKSGPALIIKRKNNGYVLLFNNKEGVESKLRLKLDYAKSFDQKIGRNRIDFHTPYAVSRRWRINVPKGDLRVHMPSAMERSNSYEKSGASTFSASLKAGAGAYIEWTPKSEGAKGLKALVNVNVLQRGYIEEGIFRVKARFDYDVSRSPVSELLVGVPVGYRVVNVFSSSLREWSIKMVEGEQIVKARLFKALIGKRKLELELETFLKGQNGYEINMPLIRAIGVNRQNGLLLVNVASGFRADLIKRSGLAQVDASEISGNAAKETWDYSYNYSVIPFELKMKVNNALPRISAETLVDYDILPEEVNLRFLSIYNIRNAGVFELTQLVPKNFDIQSVKGVSLKNAKALSVDAYHRDGDRLTISLAKKSEGLVALMLVMRHRFSDEFGLNDTGETKTLDLRIPKLPPEDFVDIEAKLLLRCPESLRVTPAQKKDLRSISFDKATKGFSADLMKLESKPVLAYALAGSDAKLKVNVERRKPHVSICQLLSVNVEPGSVKYRDALSYNILYNGVKSLSLDVPADISDKIRILDPKIQRRIEKNSDKGDKWRTWILSSDTEFIGNGLVTLEWEEIIGALDVGGSVKLQVPALKPLDVDRSWGQIVIGKAELIDLSPTGLKEGLRSIDPRHEVKSANKITDAVRAYEFHGDWRLSLKATRYEAKSVKATSIESGLVRFVVTRAKETGIQAVYRMRSNRQRLAIDLPREIEFDSQPLRINDRPIPLEKGKGDRYYVPLSGISADEPFILELRYVTRNTDLDLSCPSFPMDPAVQQVYLALYLPDNKRFIASSGPWTMDSTWTLKGLQPISQGSKSDASLINRVVDNLPVNQKAILDFPTDGGRILFSALRPPGGSKGVLKVYAFTSWLMKSITLCVVLVFGLGLCRTRFGFRVLFVGCVIISLIALGVIIPSAACSLFSGSTFWALVIVAMVWFIQLILKLEGVKLKKSEFTSSGSSDESASSRFSGIQDKPHSETAEKKVDNENEDSAPENAPEGGESNEK